MNSVLSNLLYGIYLLLCCPCEVVSIRNRRRRRRQYLEDHRTILPEEREARQKARDDNAPVPLPATRPRALTLPLPEMDGTTVVEQVTKQQGQSVLFRKIPLEIRMMIYTYVLVSRSSWVHVIRKEYKRLAHFRCKGYCKLKSRDPCWGSLDIYGDWDPGKEGAGTDGGNLPLLRTCRKMYAADTAFSL